MSGDFDGDYAGIALQAMEAGLKDVVKYLDVQQRFVHETRFDNEELRKENLRLHDMNKELGERLDEQRERLKPDRSLIDRKTLMVALELLEAADVVFFMTADDIRSEIRAIKE